MDIGYEAFKQKVDNLKGQGSKTTPTASAEDALKKAQAEYEANPTPIKLMKLNRARTAAGQGPFSPMK
jgi:hypothetical protein